MIHLYFKYNFYKILDIPMSFIVLIFLLFFIYYNTFMDFIFNFYIDFMHINNDNKYS